MAKLPFNEKWESILEDCLSEHGYSTFRLNISRHKKVKKCSGNILKVLVEGRKERDFKIEFLIMKTVSELNEEDPNIAAMFNTESFIYDQVIPKFEMMQSALARSDKLQFPFCYKSAKNFIIMEDLTIKNFELEPNMLNFEQTAMALTYLGMFHAFSFASRYKNNDDFESWTKDLNRDFFSYPENNKEALEDAIKSAEDLLEDDNLKTKFRNSFNKSKCLQPPLDYQYTVICHGDYTSQNLLFSIDEDMEPTDVIMIDYQFSSVSSPVTDIQSLLLTSSAIEVILHYDRLVDIYYDSLRLYLKKFQCLIKDCYPGDVFQKNLTEHINSSLLRMVITSKSYLNLEDGTSVFNSHWYRKRINDVVRVLTEIEVL